MMNLLNTPAHRTPLNQSFSPLPNNNSNSLLSGDASTSQSQSISMLKRRERRESNLSTISLSPRRHNDRKGSIASSRTVRGQYGLDRKSSMLWNVHTSHLPEASLEDLSFSDEEEERGDWAMVDRMRNWRNDAMTQHLYDTARFWGEKLWGITKNPNDAFWLAQIHFYTHQFLQAYTLLSCPVEAKEGVVEGERLMDISLACKYLAAQSLVRLTRWEEALEVLGGTLEKPEILTKADLAKSDGGIKLKASICHLRGLIHLHLGATDLAKASLKEALQRDIKCFESFNLLVGGEMMGIEEEWAFVNSLEYEVQVPEEADFVKMMYLLRLRKGEKDASVVRGKLKRDYGLEKDPDVMISAAEDLYKRFKFGECYQLTMQILELHATHEPTIPIHLACMSHQPHLRSQLYLFAHNLLSQSPNSHLTWYAIGIYYFSTKNYAQARRFFGKCALINPRYPAAWIAFAHSYAMEGEWDQAVTAYSTAMRYSGGSLDARLGIGMVYLGVGNLTLASQFLGGLVASDGEGKKDPLVCNEMGAVAYLEGRYKEAVGFFTTTLEIVRSMQASPGPWTVTHLNLGHSYRKLGLLDKAEICFRQVIALKPRMAEGYQSLGLTLHLKGELKEAIVRYHETLTLLPTDLLTSEFLRLALEEDIESFESLPCPPEDSEKYEKIVRDMDAMDSFSIEGEGISIQSAGESMQISMSLSGKRRRAGDSEDEEVMMEDTMAMDISL